MKLTDIWFWSVWFVFVRFLDLYMPKKTNLGQFLVLQFELWLLRSTRFSTAKWKCYQNNHINYKIWLLYGFYKFGEVCGYVCLKNTVWGAFCPQNRVFWRFQAKPIDFLFQTFSYDFLSHAIHTIPYSMFFRLNAKFNLPCGFGKFWAPV